MVDENVSRNATLVGVMSKWCIQSLTIWHVVNVRFIIPRFHNTTGGIPAELATMSNLQELSLTGNQLTGKLNYLSL